jgi:hypothetical protein
MARSEDTVTSPTFPKVQDAVLEEHIDPTKSRRPVKLALVDELFGSFPVSDDFSEPETSLISTASVRKAWHKVARQETLRAYNSGQTDGSHVRVAWPNSTIRKETVKVISTWKFERAQFPKEPVASSPDLFNWNNGGGSFETQDTHTLNVTSPTNPPSTSSHSRNKSYPVPSTAVSDVPVNSFGWSTVATEQSSWPDNSFFDALPSSSTRSASQPLRSGRDSLQHRRAVTISGTLGHVGPTEASSSSMELFRSQNIKTSGADNLEVPSLPEFDTPQKATGNDVELRATPVANNASDLVEDEDEDWGEMMHSSPIVEPSDNTTPAEVPSEAEEIVLSRKKSRPERQPSFTVSQGPQLPAPWFSELPQTAPVRSYLMNKVARSTSYSSLAVEASVGAAVDEKNDIEHHFGSQNSLPLDVDIDEKPKSSPKLSNDGARTWSSKHIHFDSVSAISDNEMPRPFENPQDKITTPSTLANPISSESNQEWHMEPKFITKEANPEQTLEDDKDDSADTRKSPHLLESLPPLLCTQESMLVQQPMPDKVNAFGEDSPRCNEELGVSVTDSESGKDKPPTFSLSYPDLDSLNAFRNLSNQDEEILAEVLNNIPSLSYMLR